MRWRSVAYNVMTDIFTLRWMCWPWNKKKCMAKKKCSNASKSTLFLICCIWTTVCQFWKIRILKCISMWAKQNNRMERGWKVIFQWSKFFFSVAGTQTVGKSNIIIKINSNSNLVYIIHIHHWIHQNKKLLK